MAALLLALGLSRACLSHGATRVFRGQRGSNDVVPVVFETDSLEDALEDALSAYAGPDEVDVFCHDEETTRCGHSLAEDLDEASDEGNFTEKILAEWSVEEKQWFAADMKRSCVGPEWNKDKCKAFLQHLRDMAVPTFKRSAEHSMHSGSFKSIHKMCRASEVKQFRQGGGIRADIPCRTDGKDAHVFYRHIYKAAGLAIKANLNIDAGRGGADYNDLDWMQNKRCDQWAHLRAQGSNPRPVLFTFVRDPIEHFIAGYKELCARDKISQGRGFEMGTPEHAMAFIDMVVNGNCDNGHVLLQSQSLIGYECESQFDFIGKLENFEQDWHRLSDTAGCDKDIGWLEQPEHESEADAIGADAVMRSVLNGDRALMRLLCWWFLPDFVNFDYSVPEACKDAPEELQGFVRI